jgi:preprotein translocase subunit SecG
VEVLTSVLLIGIVLLQKSKSEGLGLAFGSGSGDTVFGSRAGNVLTRATIVLAIVFMANTLALAVMFGGGQRRSLMQQYTGPQTAGGSGEPRTRAVRTGVVVEAEEPEAAKTVTTTLPGMLPEDDTAVQADTVEETDTPAEPAELPAE